MIMRKQNTKDEHLTLRISKDLKKKIKSKSQKEEISVSKIIRQAIRKIL